MPAMQTANYSKKTKADLILLLQSKDALEEQKQVLLYLSIIFFSFAVLFWFSPSGIPSGSQTEGLNVPLTRHED